MEIIARQIPTRRSRDRAPASAAVTILLAISLGLAVGYLDLMIMFVKKYCWNELKTLGSGRDSAWSVPLGHVILLVVPGVIVAAVNRLRPRPISLRAETWLFVTLGLWFALLRMPLYGVSTLLLAAGLARPISGALVGRNQISRVKPSTCAALVVPLVALAALSTGGQLAREQRASARLPAPPPAARNVLLIVWDTVRAANLSAFGYLRDTTPNLGRWSWQGVRFGMALAPAPWTFPSHSCFFTGQWPFKLNSQWTYTLDAPDPTLAEYLASRGYETAGFSANTACVSYENGLDRGFTHFEDYPLTPWSFVGRTVPGNWLLKNLISRNEFHEHKWLRFQSRDARSINQAFFDWLEKRRQNRPFFAFLNYFDAHEPYVPPPNFAGRFGIRPGSVRDYHFLLDYGEPGFKRIAVRDAMMARDCYDDCIAYLDDQLGRLLNQLQHDGLLENTLVILTSDHGESFGAHGSFLHPTSVYLDELAVPLVILFPGAPARRFVSEPISLRDLPATVVDLLGLSLGSPFPGRSLASYWSGEPVSATKAPTPALSEYTTPTAMQRQDQQSFNRRGVQMSIVDFGRHYMRDGLGTEQLYDLRRDPLESVNLMTSEEGTQLAQLFRRKLLDALTANPGSIEAENAYLKPFRQWLRSDVEKKPAAIAPVFIPDRHSDGRPELLSGQ
jgi:arylsulfatase A-like enzyme